MRWSHHIVADVVPDIHEALAKAPERGQDAVAGQRRGEDRKIELAALAGDHLRHTPSRLGRVHDAVAAIAHGIVDLLAFVRLEDAGHHVVADIHPAPPGIVEINAAKRREFSIQALLQQREVLRVLGVLAGDRAAAADLHAAVRQIAVVVPQGARVGERRAGLETAGLLLVVFQRPGDDRVGEDRHQPVLGEAAEAGRGIARGRQRHRACPDRAAGRGQVMDAVHRLPAHDRARRVDGDVELSRQVLIAEGELRRVDADAVRLVHGARRFLLLDEALVQLVPAHHPGAIAEDVVQQCRLLLQPGHDRRLVRDVDMAAVLRIAVEFAGPDQIAKDVERLDHLAVHFLRDIHAPTLDPLRALETSGRDLRLAAVPRGAAPGHGIGFEHHRLDAMLLGEMDRGRKPGIAGADHHHVGVHVTRHGSIVFGRRPCRPDPVGRRIVPIVAGAGVDQRVVVRIVAGFRPVFRAETVGHYLVP